jgi:hypothetical protein
MPSPKFDETEEIKTGPVRNLAIRRINPAHERVVKQDEKYRFVVDKSSLKGMTQNLDKQHL